MAQHEDIPMVQARIPTELRAAIEASNRLLHSNPPGSPESERALEWLRALSDGPGGAAAQWLLGLWYLPRFGQPGAHAEALHWLSRAATAGVPPAIDRLANTLLRGIGIERDERGACKLLQRLAEAGFQGAAWDLGFLLDRAGFPLENLDSASAFARACALAYPPAYYSLGLRFARGGTVARDAAFARALLWRAEDAAYPDAAEAAADFDLPPREHPQVQRWYQTLKDNVEVARPLLGQLAHEGLTIQPGLHPTVRELEAQFARLAHPAMHLDRDGRLRLATVADTGTPRKAAAGRMVCSDPRVMVLPNFADREECAHLRYVSGPSLAEPSEYTGDTVNGAFETVHFKGRAHSFGAMYSDTVVRLLEQRISATLHWPMAAIEPCSVITYLPGQSYETHVDFFSREQIERNRNEANDLGGQRVITFLLCVRAPDAGGGTFYPHAGVSVGHAPGQAAIHYNVTADGEPDKHSLHRGVPVTAGEKWLLRTTLRERSRYAIED